MTPELVLRKFIIKRFISTLLIVGAVEFAVISIVNWLMLPRVIEWLMPQIEGIKLDNLGNILVLLVALAAILISNVLRLFIPSLADVILQFIAGRLTALGAERFDLENNAIQNITEKINLGNVALLLLFIVLMILMLAAPYAIGVTVFSTSVVKRFREMDRQREEERKEEERKRYLMISDIVHDLKTPMTTVSGYAQALSDGMVKENQQEYLDAIKAKTGRMNEIVTMLFDYVKLDSQGYTITKAPTDLCELLRECVADHYTDIENSGVDPEVDIPEDKIILDLDKMQFGRVINNLITNALRHNPDGTDIGVFVRRDGDEVRVLVADSGEKIDEDTAKKLFDAFATGDRSRGSSGGTGLGLFISRKICDMHGFSLKLVQNREDMARYDIGNKYRKVFVITIVLDT